MPDETYLAKCTLLCNCTLILFNLSTDTRLFRNFAWKTIAGGIYFHCYAGCRTIIFYCVYSKFIRNIIRSLRITEVYFLRRKDAGAFDLFLRATAGEIFTLWDKLVTLYERVSIRLSLQCIKRYVVAVCLMHHMRPYSFRCRYVFMFRFESFYSFESGWKCGSELHLVSRVFLLAEICEV